MTDIDFADNPSAHRFELKVAGQVAAHADYQLRRGAVEFTHTEVMPAHEGEGLGSRLAQLALDEVRRRGLKAIPVCEFIAAYIRKHPQYADLVG